MKILANAKLIGISTLLVVGMAACDKPGPAESAGKKMDQATSDASAKIGAAVDSAGVAIDDSEITAKVKAAILAEPDLKTLQISVETVKGVVTLNGSVDSMPMSDRAKSLASAVAGVKDVDNRLVLKPAK